MIPYAGAPRAASPVRLYVLGGADGHAVVQTTDSAACQACAGTVVAETKPAGTSIVIRTTFVGADQSIDQMGLPLVFETVVFVGSPAQVRSMRNYASWDAASAGHDQTIAWFAGYVPALPSANDEAMRETAEIPFSPEIAWSCSMESDDNRGIVDLYPSPDEAANAWIEGNTYHHVTDEAVLTRWRTVDPGRLVPADAFERASAMAADEVEDQFWNAYQRGAFSDPKRGFRLRDGAEAEYMALLQGWLRRNVVQPIWEETEDERIDMNFGRDWWLDPKWILAGGSPKAIRP